MQIDKSTKIAILTSINRGGTMQLTTEIYKQLKSLGYSAHCIMPKRAEFAVEDVELKDVYLYNRPLLDSPISAIFSEISVCNRDIDSLCNYIIDNKYAFVFTTDTSSFTIRVILNLKKKEPSIFSLITVHDAVPHPSYNASLKSKFYFWSSQIHRRKCLESAGALLFLSQSNLNKFQEIFPGLNENLVYMPLGAHIPCVRPKVPYELENIDANYYLFFGRLEKYKGLIYFLRAYESYKDTKYHFVIAGNGTLTDEELEVVSNNNKIILLRRYISDEEMVWLFEKSVASVLPYIEASQSGIIPISYYFSKPVICSNVDGLTQFVVDNETGFICKTLEDYSNAMKRIENDLLYSHMSSIAREYYQNTLEWKSNLDNAIKACNDILRKR